MHVNFKFGSLKTQREGLEYTVNGGYGKALLLFLLSLFPKECTLHWHCLINSPQRPGDSAREVCMNYCQVTLEWRTTQRC